jgi:hypothetical protein
MQSVFSAPPRPLLPQPLRRNRAPRRRAKNALHYGKLLQVISKFSRQRFSKTISERACDCTARTCRSRSTGGSACVDSVGVSVSPCWELASQQHWLWFGAQCESRHPPHRRNGRAEHPGNGRRGLVCLEVVREAVDHHAAVFNHLMRRYIFGWSARSRF